MTGGVKLVKLNLKTWLILLVVGISVFGFLSVAQAAVTDTLGDWAARLLAALAQLIIELVGKLFVVLIDILLAVVQYNDFINAEAVVRAWVLIRDFANMAFLLIFIAIAFATILGIEKYEYKQLLPKLLFMAVAINFSRTICGLVLDAAQVVMMTFVNGFKEVAAGNLIRGFGLTDLLVLRSGVAEGRGVDSSSLAVASLLAVIVLVISAVVLGVIVFMFVIRVIYLWILIILSPLAFLLAATPGLSGKFNEWWSQFVKYAMVGPLLAFFLWLSFSIMAAVGPTENLAESSGFRGFDPANNVSVAITSISSSGNLLSFGIAVALLLMSLSVAQSLGVKGGQLAGAALSKIQSGGVKLGKLAGLGVATGGFGAAAAYGAYRGGKTLAGTRPGKWAGRRLDELITPRVTKGIGRLGQTLFKPPPPGKEGMFGWRTRASLAAAKLAETGILMRTIPESWKARAESREKTKTAPYAGGGRDVLHAIIDKEDKNYAFRNKMALDAEEAKKQREETDATSEAYLNIAFSALRAGNTNTKDIRGALINVWNQNDQNEVTLSREIYGKDANGKAVTFGEEIHRRVLEHFERVLSDEGKQNADAYIAAQEKLRQAIERGASEQELFQIKTQELEPARNKLSTLEYEYAKHKPLRASDSPFARHEALKMFLGVDEKGEMLEDAAKFSARLTGVALENRNYAGFGLAGFQDGQYRLTDVFHEKGFAAYNGAVMGKMRNINPPELWRAHPSSFRYEIIDPNDMRTYDDDLNSVGQNLIILAAPGISERNLNLRPDASGAVFGTVAPRQYPDLYSVDPEKRARAQRDYADDNLVGYNFSLRHQVSPEAHNRTVAAYLQRQGATPEDARLTPHQALQKLRTKLPGRIQELRAAQAAYDQAVAAQAPPEEQARLQAELNNARIDVNRIKEQIARFLENISMDKLDMNAGSGESESSGSTIATPGSAEFRETEAELRERRP